MTALPNEKPYTIDDIEALPEGERAELLDGDMYMLAAPSRTHQRIAGELFSLINTHIRDSKAPCEANISPFAVFFDKYNYVEPDVFVVCDKYKLDDKGCHGAPDWIIEIVSPSSVQNDYIRKVALYERFGVREYWIVNPEKRIVRTYCFAVPDTADYSFDDDIPVGISEGFTVRVSDLL